MPEQATNEVTGEVEPGTFPAMVVDQRRSWVFPDGKLLRIRSLDEENVLFALGYCITNASRIRRHYCIETRTLYDEEQNARRWLLDKVAVRALMRRLMTLEDEKREQEGEEAKKMRWLTPGAEAAIEAGLGW